MRDARTQAELNEDITEMLLTWPTRVFLSSGTGQGEKWIEIGRCFTGAQTGAPIRSRGPKHTRHRGMEAAARPNWPAARGGESAAARTTAPSYLPPLPPAATTPSISASFIRREVELLERPDVVLELLDELAPTIAEVTRGSRSTHARAIWARLWPRRVAIASRARMRGRFFSISSRPRNGECVALDPAGTPLR